VARLSPIFTPKPLRRWATVKSRRSPNPIIRDMRVKRQTSAKYVEPQRPGDSVISFRGSASSGNGTDFSISKLADDLCKWFEILRTRPRRSAAAGFPLLGRVANDREGSLRRSTLAFAVSPVAPSAALTARCKVCAARGTQRGQTLDNAFFTSEPESEVDEEMSLRRTPKRRRRRLVQA